MITKENLIKISNNLFEIPVTYNPNMRVPARVYINDELLEEILLDKSLDQLVNMTTLPGIQKYAIAMPDIHQGYGFPIGGVAAMSTEDGVISPGGIGYDINCGVRLLAANINNIEIQKYLPEIATKLFHAVPSGVGRAGKIKLSNSELDKVLTNGAHYMLAQGYGIESDLEFCQDNGRLLDADASCVSDKAKKRGFDQLGTLGSGNHFLEVQKITEIYDEHTANIFGLHKDMVCIMIHCGSRGLGHQTCTDYVKKMLPQLEQWGIILPDRELACAPFKSQEGQEYYAAMCAAANFAWANRHVITHNVRQVFSEVIGNTTNVKTVYDISHNIGKKEVHNINGKAKEVIVHRKGATTAFVGQSVLVPGTMGTASYVLTGTQKNLEEAFASCCHGAGRRMSRSQAKKTVVGKTLKEQLESQGIIIRCDSNVGLAEEAPIAYKDVDNVVNVIESAGLATKVVKLEPIAVIKGG